MNKQIKNQFIKKLKKHCEAISKERDALRDLLDEVRDFHETADQGVSELENVIEYFSQTL